MLVWATPASANQDPVAAYNEANDQLAQLLLEREALEAAIAASGSAERVALERLESTEGILARLVREWRANEQRRAELQQRIAQTEAQTPALEMQTLTLDRQAAAHERWLLDGEAPRVRGSRAYLSALTARDRLSGDQAAVSATLAEVHAAEAAGVLELGRLNTEIAFWERQADVLSRQVGSSRARALDSSARLAKVQKEALESVEKLRERVSELRRLGYPIGAAFAADGLLPVPAMVEWPVTAPKGYGLPIGSASPALRAGEPLRVEPGAPPAPPPLPATTWTLPVRGVVTTPFGDSTPYQAAHWAIDIGSRLYEPVRAAADGVVEFAGLAATDNRLASYGAVVALRHEQGLTSLYAHLDDRAYGSIVQPGEAVKQGQVIGHVGITGNTTGPHVHFEARLDGRPFDPLLLVKAP